MKTPVKILASMLAGAAFGYLLFGWLAPKLMTGLADGPSMGTGLKVALFPAVVVGMLLVLAVHELGHVAGGLMARFRFLLLIVGPLRLTATASGLRAGLNTSLAMAGGLAACAPRPGDMGDLSRRTAAMVAGGPLASLVLGLGGLLLGRALGLDHPATPLQVYGAAVLQIVSIASLGIFVVTLIPAKTSGFHTDGARLLQLVRGVEDADAQGALAAVTSWGIGGIRPRDWDPEVVATALRIADPAARAVALHAAWKHEVDRAGPDHAAHPSPSTLQAREELLRAIDDLPEVVRPIVYLELALDSAMGGEGEGAEELLSKAGKPGPFVDPHLPLLTRAAVLLARGGAEGVGALIDQAEAALGSAMDGGGAALDRERIQALRARLTEGRLRPSDPA